jgi:hypothetical protein
VTAPSTRSPSPVVRTPHVRLPGAVPDNGQVTTRERLARNDAVVAARARGLTWPTIAERFGLEERQCRRIVDEYRSDRPLPYDRDPMTVIRETLEQYDALAEEAALLAEDTRHAGARLGTIRTRLDSARAKLELLQLAGLVPSDLGQLGVVLDAQRVAALLVDVLERHAVPDRVVDEILMVVDDVPAQALPA